MTPFRSFIQRLRGTNTGTIYSNPAGSNKIALVSVYTPPVPLVSQGDGSYYASRVGSVIIGGRTMSIANSLYVNGNNSSNLASAHVSGMVMPGENVQISISGEHGGVSWEIVELNIQT